MAPVPVDVRSLFLPLVLGILLALAGCAPQPPDPGRASVLADMKMDGSEADAVAACLTDRGWTVDRGEGTSILSELPSDQRPAYDKDYAACVREGGINPDTPLTDQQFAVVYDWSVEIGECLENAGWPVPPQPSKEVFVQTYETAPWIPWSEVQGQDWEEAVSICPVLEEQG